MCIEPCPFVCLSGWLARKTIRNMRLICIKGICELYSIFVFILTYFSKKILYGVLHKPWKVKMSIHQSIYHSCLSIWLFVCLSVKFINLLSLREHMVAISGVHVHTSFFAAETSLVTVHQKDLIKVSLPFSNFVGSLYFQRILFSNYLSSVIFPEGHWLSYYLDKALLYQ